MLKLINKTLSQFEKLKSSGNLEHDAIYYLSNGMFFIRGQLYGQNNQFVDEFPENPIPGVLYFNNNTREKRIWSDNGDFFKFFNDEIDMTEYVKFSDFNSITLKDLEKLCDCEDWE